MKVKITFTSTFQLQDATGPNPQRKRYEIIDASGDRISYANSIKVALADIRDFMNPEGDIDGVLEVEEP